MCLLSCNPSVYPDSLQPAQTVIEKVKHVLRQITYQRKLNHNKGDSISFHTIKSSCQIKLTHAVNIHSCHPNRYIVTLCLAKFLHSQCPKCAFFSYMHKAVIYIRTVCLKDLIHSLALGKNFLFLWHSVSWQPLLQMPGCECQLQLKLSFPMECIRWLPCLIGCWGRAGGKQLARKVVGRFCRKLIFLFSLCVTQWTSGTTDVFMYEGSSSCNNYFSFYSKDEKNQMMTTNVWVKQVRDYERTR